ncbi:MAG TPA: ABC transporter ATP-binding protein [Actinomycetota bacterium]|nr:ABC transporter ATP-binding protein [Actinomycetota bacterium]
MSRRVRGGKRILHDVSFSVEPGELVAIVGGSGAGKSTLLDAIAGVHPADEGAVLYNGVDLYGNIGAFRSRLGYVPQEDIIHRELPLELTLRYAARLRLPAGTSREEIDASVAHTMDALDLTERAELRVGSLSGGQRKLSASGGAAHHAEVFFLEEPTSGLDPATESDMMRLLRRLADSGSTVILTTHAPEKIGICDKVVFLARGHLAFFGRPEEATEYFVVDSFAEIYERLGQEATPEEWGHRFEASRKDRAIGDASWPEASGDERAASVARPIGPVGQWALLTRRNIDILVRNRLTLAILVGTPVLVVLMFVVLFKPGAFDFAHPSPSATIMILYWIAFGGFFFGLTYGLAADRHRAPDLPTGATGEPPDRAVRDVEARRAGPLPGGRRRGDARDPAGLRPVAERGVGRLGIPGRHPPAGCRGRPGSRPVDLCGSLRAGAGNGSHATAVLPPGAVLRGHLAGADHGDDRQAPELPDVGPVGVRGTRARTEPRRAAGQRWQLAGPAAVGPVWRQLLQGRMGGLDDHGRVRCAVPGSGVPGPGPPGQRRGALRSGCARGRRR